MPELRWRLLTPADGGAIACIAIHANPDDFFQRAEMTPVETGRVALRTLPGGDRGVVAHPSPNLTLLFPHAGSASVGALQRALEQLGVRAAGDAPSSSFVEAQDEIEARALDAMARAHAPRAIEHLLAQPERWREDSQAVVDAPELMRLIDPPLVVCCGPPNVGKSTLLNALAGRSVALVADVAGTTRDHVGVELVVGGARGLAVRFIDTPGLGLDGASDIDDQAIELALEIIRDADLVLCCGDRHNDLPRVATGAPTIRVALRLDLGQPDFEFDVGVAIPPEGRPTGLETLADSIRDALIPPGLLEDPRAWRFWGS